MIEGTVKGIVGLFALAILVEGIITYFVSDPEKPQPWLKYVSAGLGILVSVLYNLDLLAAFGIVSTIPFVGSVLTGFIVGRGSNYLNDIISKIRAITSGIQNP